MTVPAVAATTSVSQAARRSPSIAAPHIELASMTVPGTLRYPDDVATRYAFETSGGEVSAKLSMSGHARLTLRLECAGVRTRRSGGRVVSLGASVPGGSCSLLVSAPPLPSSSATSYRLLVHFPAEVP